MGYPFGFIVLKTRRASYTPATINRPLDGGFINVGGQAGVGIQGSPATLINVQGTYQYTPVVVPILKQ